MTRILPRNGEVEYSNGTKHWYKNGKLHRVDGPAIEYYNGTKEWWIDGELHRVDGPAVEYYNGGKYWWVNGINLEDDLQYLNKFLSNPGVDPGPFEELLDKLWTISS